MSITKINLGRIALPNAETVTLAAGDGLIMADSGTLKQALISDIAVLLAGGATGMGASNGQLTLSIVNADVNGSAAIDLDKLDWTSEGAVLTDFAQNDKFFLYATDGTVIKSITASALEDAIFGNVSGDASIAAGGALTLGSGVVEHGMLAEDIISGQAELAHADIADADELMISDAGTIKRVGVDSLRDHYFGVVSGDATIADGGALTIAAGAVDYAMLASAGIKDEDNMASNSASHLVTQQSVKAYVDAQVSGMDVKESVAAAYTASFTMASTASSSTLVLASGEGGWTAAGSSLGSFASYTALGSNVTSSSFTTSTTSISLSTSVATGLDDGDVIRWFDGSETYFAFNVDGP